MISVWEPWIFLSYQKCDYWVVKNVQMDWFIICTKSINNRIKYIKSITNFMRQTINQFFSNVTYWVLTIQILFVNWSMNWCWFWTEITSSACICLISNRFGPYSWYKWSLWTIRRSHNPKINNLISSSLKYKSVPHHDTTNILESLYTLLFGIGKFKAVSIVILCNIILFCFL